MEREQWQPKHVINLVIILAAIIAIVLLAVFTDGSHVDAVIGFVGGLLIPGSPLPPVFGQESSKPDDPKP